MPLTIAGKNAAAKEASESEPHAPRDHGENSFWLQVSRILGRGKNASAAAYHLVAA